MQSGQILGPRRFRLQIESGQTPAVSNLGAVSFPQFQVNGRPDRHENGEEYRHRIIDKVRYSRVGASGAQLPKVADLVAQRTHDRVRGTNVATQFVRVERQPTVQETEQSHDGRGDQHVRIKS